MKDLVADLDDFSLKTDSEKLLVINNLYEAIEESTLEKEVAGPIIVKLFENYDSGPLSSDLQKDAFMKLVKSTLQSMKGCGSNKKLYSVSDDCVDTMLARIVDLDNVYDQVDVVSVIFRITPGKKKEEFMERHKIHKSFNEISPKAFPRECRIFLCYLPGSREPKLFPKIHGAKHVEASKGGAVFEVQSEGKTPLDVNRIGLALPLLEFDLPFLQMAKWRIKDVKGDRLLEIQMNPEWIEENDGFISIALTLKEDTYTSIAKLLELNQVEFMLQKSSFVRTSFRPESSVLTVPGEINSRMANEKWAEELKREETGSSAEDRIAAIPKGTPVALSGVRTSSSIFSEDGVSAKKPNASLLKMDQDMEHQDFADANRNSAESEKISLPTAGQKVLIHVPETANPPEAVAEVFIPETASVREEIEPAIASAKIAKVPHQESSSSPQMLIEPISVKPVVVEVESFPVTHVSPPPKLSEKRSSKGGLPKLPKATEQRSVAKPVPSRSSKGGLPKLPTAVQDGKPPAEMQTQKPWLKKKLDDDFAKELLSDMIPACADDKFKTVAPQSEDGHSSHASESASEVPLQPVKIAFKEVDEDEKKRTKSGFKGYGADEDSSSSDYVAAVQDSSYRVPAAGPASKKVKLTKKATKAFKAPPAARVAKRSVTSRSVTSKPEAKAHVPAPSKSKKASKSSSISDIAAEALKALSSPTHAVANDPVSAPPSSASSPPAKTVRIFREEEQVVRTVREERPLPIKQAQVDDLLRPLKRSPEDGLLQERLTKKPFITVPLLPRHVPILNPPRQGSFGGGAFRQSALERKLEIGSVVQGMYRPVVDTPVAPLRRAAVGGVFDQISPLQLNMPSPISQGIPSPPDQPGSLSSIVKKVANVYEEFCENTLKAVHERLKDQLAPREIERIVENSIKKRLGLTLQYSSFLNKAQKSISDMEDRYKLRRTP